MPISRSNKKKRIIAITMGDPGGIGPEVIVKALSSRKIKQRIRKENGRVVFILVGNREVFDEAKKITRSSIQFSDIDCVDRKTISAKKINMLDLGDDATEVMVGKVALANAALSYHALEVGAYMALHGVVDALVTGPINKEAVQLMSPSFTGHTEYLAHLAKVKNFAMLIQGGPLRCVFATTHCSFRKVPELLTSAKILSKIELAHNFLKKRVKIRRPRIGIAALNPHAGEGGRMGNEENRILKPAIRRAIKKGYNVCGPIPADIVFHEAYNEELDAIIAMYHDQGLGPLKMVAFHSGVNITLNLPFLRTSPDHGTAFDIAYKNKAHPGSMIEAITTAIDLT